MSDNAKTEEVKYTGQDPSSEKYYCPACGYATLDEPGGSGSYDICHVCNWEDDSVQFKDPDYEGGANGPSLSQAKKNFAECGASDPKCSKNCNPPGDRNRDPEYVY